MKSKQPWFFNLFGELLIFLILLGFVIVFILSRQVDNNLEIKMATLQTEMASVRLTVEANPPTVSTPSPSITDDLIPFSASIGFTFVDGQEENTLFYPVDRVTVYPSLQAFREAWTNNTSAIIQWAWQPTQPGEDRPQQGRIFWGDSTITDEQIRGIESWREYIFMASVPNISNLDTNIIRQSELFVTQSPAQVITDTHVVTNEFSLEFTLSEAIEYLEDEIQSTGTIERLMLLDASGDSIEHILVFVGGEGVSDPGSQDCYNQLKCNRCTWLACQVKCWWVCSRRP